MGKHVVEWSYCEANNQSIRHMSYCLSNLYIMYSLFTHLSGTSTQQMMLFQLQLHEGFAVIFSLISSMYCLYEYSSEPGGMPFMGYAVVDSLRSIIVWPFFLASVMLLVWWTPEVYTPVIFDGDACGDCLDLQTLKVGSGVVSYDVVQELIWVQRTTGSESSLMNQLYLPQISRSGSDFKHQVTSSSPSQTTEEYEEDKYVHPLLLYYNEHHRIPPFGFFLAYLSEIVFFWRFSLFILTVGYKLLVFVSSYSTGYRYWAQILNPLSTSALIVHWMLVLRCNYNDRVSNQALNFHFWFHALSEIPTVVVWIRERNIQKSVFNIVVMVILWPLIFIGCKRIIYTLNMRSVSSRLSTSTQFFIEGTGLMVVQFYLAFQSHSCILVASRQDLGLGYCKALLHTNLWSGMNIAMTFLVVRVLFFKLGGLSISKLLRLQLRSYEVLVLLLCALSGSVSLYFFANKDQTTGVLARPSTVIQGIETASMVGYILVFLLMAYKHWEEPVDGDVGYTALDTMMESFYNNQSPDTFAAEEEAESEVVLPRDAASKHQECSKRHSPDIDGMLISTRPRQSLHKKDRSTLSPSGIVNASEGCSPMSHEGSTMGCERGGVAVHQRRKSGSVLYANCCPCWMNFSLWMDHRNSGSNVRVFRLILCSGTVVYIILMIGTAIDRVERDYAASMEGISLACVCCHWLITVEQQTAPIEVLHLLGHAFAEFTSIVFWIFADKRLETIHSILSFLAVYPCLYHGVYALKLGLRRKFDQKTLVDLASNIAKQSFILLLVLLYLFFESFGCVYLKSADNCQEVLSANKQMGVSALLAFLVYLSLVVVQDVDTRRVLCMELSPAQLLVFLTSALAIVLSSFSIASRHSHRGRSDRVDYMIEIVTLICWYAALIILWIRRPWYDIELLMSDGDEHLHSHLAMTPIISR